MKKGSFRSVRLVLVLCIASFIVFAGIIYAVSFNDFSQSILVDCQDCNQDVSAANTGGSASAVSNASNGNGSGAGGNGNSNGSAANDGGAADLSSLSQGNSDNESLGKFSVSGQPFTDKEVIVTYDSNISSADRSKIQEILDSKGAKESGEITSTLSSSDNFGQTVSVSVEAGKEEELVNALSNVSGVANAQRNFIYRLTDAESVNATEGQLAAEEASTTASVSDGADAAEATAMLSSTATDAVSAQTAAADTAAATQEASATTQEATTPTSTQTTSANLRAVTPQTPNDKNISKQYYLSEWQESDTTSGINMYNAWGLAHTNQSVSIALLDSGVRTTHEDLKANIDTDNMANIEKIFDGAYIVNQGSMTVTSYHGSHVAGLAAAATNNSVGMAGVSYNARIIPIQVFYYDSKEGYMTDTGMLMKAYSYLKGLIDAGELTDLHVINMSLGGYAEPEETDFAFEKVIKTMRDKYGIISVVAGGNGDKSGNAYTATNYPSDFDEVFSVTALAQNGTNAKFSDYNMSKDISAPGVNIYSCGTDSDSNYITLKGTSMAAPMVSGVAALLWTVQPDLTVDEAVEAMQMTAHALDPNGENYHSSTQTGSPGCIDAYESVNYVIKNFGGVPNIDGSIITNDCVTLSYTTTVYTGETFTPDVEVWLKGEQLEKDVDYTLGYYNNIDVGTAYVKVVGIGDYSGGATKKFTIAKAPVTWKGLAGGTALSTMKAIVQEGFSSANTVVIASKDGYWDALSASGLAGLYNCPILLTAQNELSAQTASEINRLKPETAFIVGGTSAVSEEVEASLVYMGLDVTRLAGGTAVTTSLAVYNYAKDNWGQNAIVASSSSYHDALSIASYAYAKNAPIILAQSSSKTLTNRAANVLKSNAIKRVIIVGGSAAVSTEVETSQLAGKSITRLGAGTAYSTSRVIAQWCINQGMNANNIGVACGTGYHDALCASALCGKNNAVLVLVSETQHTCINSVIAEYKNKILTAYFFGGEQAISANLRQTCMEASD